MIEYLELWSILTGRGPYPSPTTSPYLTVQGLTARSRGERRVSDHLEQWVKLRVDGRIEIVIDVVKQAEVQQDLTQACLGNIECQIQ